MNKKYLLTSSLIIILIIAFALTGFTLLKLNKDGNTYKIPDNLTWNEDLKEYYNSDDFIWNAERQMYEVRLDNKDTSYINLDDIIYPDEWVEQNKNSDDELTVALINYYYAREKLYSENPLLGIRSYYLPEDDTALNILYDLGIEFIPEMYENIKDNCIWSNTLMYAVMGITGVSVNILLPSSDAEGVSRWKKNLSTLVTEAGTAVENLSNKAGSADSLDKYGLFVLPYLSDGITSGNENILPYLTPAVREYLGIGTEASAAQIEAAFAAKGEDIEILRSFIKTVTQ